MNSAIAFEGSRMDGSGYGSGSGSGYGSGSGSGSGYGSGYGDGSGSGYGDLKTSEAYHSALSDVQAATQARQKGAVVALWKSDAQGRPANGGSKTVAHPGLIEELKPPLVICTARALHATFNPSKWNGERWWVVALYGEVAIQEDKVGALKREIICELV